MRSSNPFGGAMHSFRRSYTPATVVLMVVNIFSFFVAATPTGHTLFHWLGFSTADWITRPWTLVTWTLVTAVDPFFMLFISIYAWMTISSMERSWGTRTFVPFFLITSAIMALAFNLGAVLLKVEGSFAGLGLICAPGPSAVAWAFINRHEKINIWGVLPAPASAVAVFACVVVWFYSGSRMSPLLGLFPLAGCAAAYWYAKDGRYKYRGYAENRSYRDNPPSRNKPGLRLVDLENDVRPGGSPFDRINPMRIYRSWRMKKEVEKLFRRGTGTDPKDR